MSFQFFSRIRKGSRDGVRAFGHPLRNHCIARHCTWGKFGPGAYGAHLFNAPLLLVELKTLKRGYIALLLKKNVNLIFYWHCL